MQQPIQNTGTQTAVLPTPQMVDGYEVYNVSGIAPPKRQQLVNNVPEPESVSDLLQRDIKPIRAFVENCSLNRFRASKDAMSGQVKT